MNLQPETIDVLKRKAGMLAESASQARALIGQLEEVVRRLDSNITSLVAEDVRSVNAAVRSYQIAHNSARAFEQVKVCIDAVREVVTAARTAGYQDQRAPATPRA